MDANSSGRSSDSSIAAAGTGILPPPPVFKPTFVQMQRSSSSCNISPTGSASTSPKMSGSSNSSYLTSSFVSNDEYKNRLIRQSPSISPMMYAVDAPSPGPTSPAQSNSRKRRKSSVTSKEDMERKKKELRNQHSIIEKKRRIKMNREFEALKFLVPACRLNILSGLNENNFDNSNMMHKLTILQSTVEYIKYLHLVIKLLKLQMLTPASTRSYFQNWLAKNDNLKFVDFDLDLQSYRKIDNDFSFEDAFTRVWRNNGDMPFEDLDAVSREIESLLNQDSDDKEAPVDLPDIRNLSDQLPTQLPSPIVTPDIGRSGLPSCVRPVSSLLTSERTQVSSNAKFKLPLPAIVDEKLATISRTEDEMGELNASRVLMLLKSDEKRTSIESLLN
ncbi:hypothetical protein KL921_003268 [Ogataea angusta]|uniref:BHLH domain-containing protein n=1 Tax=Pichia angusta TaxID=870730 RepID=A0AAN6DD37_PICAN|nr:uncharacterized protein KL928_003506 [Ogataea angusta]KAG7809271.1 hypothetical protein KL921_003268 [Ogataea angusta]KAG7817607.1 hypothetical protein KL928_003506 [Ogataea angusta]KAG7839511.1 hypothetical protein KL942_003122 [Ogataea angusta]KAG7845428.1 hypothetical protein KL941_003274 [Ogataea angusta]KAG7845829.1 hypothetical protein KL940_004874 [Ogataea angusta]